MKNLILILLLTSFGAPQGELAKSRNLIRYSHTPLSGRNIKNPPDEGADLLFKGVRTKLTANDKIDIYSKLNFKVSADKKGFIQFIPVLNTITKETFTATVLPTDLNHDGVEEIFISYGNCETSGNTCNEIALYIKNIKGHYAEDFDMAGLIPDVIISTKKFPDLIIGGPGMYRPLMRWNGSKYINNATIDFSGKKQPRTIDIEKISKAYQASLKAK